MSLFRNEAIFPSSITFEDGTVQTTAAKNIPGSTNIGVVDIQGFGDGPDVAVNKYTTTTVATGTSGTLLRVAATNSFRNNGGVAIYGAGSSCALSTPSAPTVAQIAGVTGSTTFKYAVVAIDAASGLTAASSTTSITSAPAIFNPLPVTITSASASAGTVTVQFSGNINATNGNTIHISGLTGSGSTWNGCWYVASAPTTSSVTYAVSGATGTATVTGATGRLSNAQQISAISRSAAGVVTVTTAAAHGYSANTSGTNPIFCIINGVTGDTSYNGYFVPSTASGTSLTINTGNLSSSTGTCVVGAATIQIYEVIRITCPAIASYTVGQNTYYQQGFYIYSDRANPGGSMQLIGRTMAYETNFLDFGPLFQSGFQAPSYVPTTAPASQTNQIFSATINSGGGTALLTLSTSIPNPSVGQTVLHDDAPALVAAINYVTGTTNYNGTISFTPPQSVISNPVYQLASPVIVPQNVSLNIGAPIRIYETLVLNGFNALNGQYGANARSSQFGNGPYQQIFCFASPSIVSNGGLNMNNLFIENQWNATWGFQISPLPSGNLPLGENAIIENCYFGGGNYASTVPAVLSSADLVTFRDCTFDGGSPILGNSNNSGNCSFFPYFPSLLLFWSNTNTQGVGQISVKGQTLFGGRGIWLDQFSNQGNSNWFDFGGDGATEFQGPVTPGVTFWGPGVFQSRINEFVCDSVAAPVLANLGIHTASILMDRCFSAGGLMVSGYAINGLETLDSAATVAQSYVLSRITGGTITTSGGTSDTITLPGVASNSILSYSAGNSTAATDIKNGNVYISVSGNVVTLTHGTTSGMVFYVTATAGF